MPIGSRIRNSTRPKRVFPSWTYVFAEIEKWTMTMTKMEVMATLNPLNVPCGPILSMKELAEEPALRKTGTVVEVDHPTARQVSDGRQSDQAVGFACGCSALAAARRAHRRGPADRSRPE